jgi:hypothetical protein
VTPSTLRARAAAFFIEPRPPATRPGDLADLVPLVRRDPPPPALASLEPPPSSPPVGQPPRVSFEPRPPGFAPPEPARRGPPALSPPGTPSGPAPRAAVLGLPAHAVPAAAALACALRAAHGSGSAVVATWVPGEETGPAPRGPGAPAAARAAARLTARGLLATAHGRLAWLPLSGHVVAASVAARRASAVLDVPLVIALAGPRCDIVESLLGEQDLVVVVTADPDSPLARIAVAGCARPATARRPPHGARRLLALAGVEGRASEIAGWWPR